MKDSMLLQSEGIVLHAIPFKEYDQIVTLFTPQCGILKLFVKGNKRSTSFHHALTAPLTKAEYFYTATRGDLFAFHEGRVLNQHLGCRESYNRLEVGQKMMQAVIKSQWPGKPSPPLYALLSAFLNKLEISDHPETLLGAFLMKLLKVEGSFQLRSNCSSCRCVLTEGGYRKQGARFCKIHKGSEDALYFSDEEEKILYLLSHLRNISEILALEVESVTLSKIDILFRDSLES